MGQQSSVPQQQVQQVPLFQAGVIVQLAEELRVNPATASYYVVDAFDHMNIEPVFRDTYFLRAIDEKTGSVDQGIGIRRSARLLAPLPGIELPLQTMFEQALDRATTFGTPELLEQSDLRGCRVMETPEYGVCSSDTNLTDDNWCRVPAWAYYRIGNDCYDIRELLQHVNYQLTSEPGRQAARPSFPLNRQPITPGQLEYLVLRAQSADYPIPINILKALEVYRDRSDYVDADPVTIYEALNYRNRRRLERERLDDALFFEETHFPRPGDPNAPVMMIRREIAALRPAY